MDQKVDDIEDLRSSCQSDGLTLEQKVEILCSLLTDPKTPGDVTALGIAALIDASRYETRSEDDRVERDASKG
jgi:hypothetical protein